MSLQTAVCNLMFPSHHWDMVWSGAGYSGSHTVGQPVPVITGRLLPATPILSGSHTVGQLRDPWLAPSSHPHIFSMVAPEEPHRSSGFFQLLLSTCSKFLSSGFGGGGKSRLIRQSHRVTGARRVTFQRARNLHSSTHVSLHTCWINLNKWKRVKRMTKMYRF